MEPTDSKLQQSALITVTGAGEDVIRHGSTWDRVSNTAKHDRKKTFEGKQYLPWICPYCGYNNTNLRSVCENNDCEKDRPDYDELKEKIDLQWKERELKRKSLEGAKWPPWWRPRLTRTTSTPLKSRTIPRSLSSTTTSTRLAPSPATIFPRPFQGRRRCKTNLHCFRSNSHRMGYTLVETIVKLIGDEKDDWNIYRYKCLKCDQPFQHPIETKSSSRMKQRMPRCWKKYNKKSQKLPLIYEEWFNLEGDSYIHLPDNLEKTPLYKEVKTILTGPPYNYSDKEAEQYINRWNQIPKYCCPENTKRAGTCTSHSYRAYCNAEGRQ